MKKFAKLSFLPLLALSTGLFAGTALAEEVIIKVNPGPQGQAQVQKLGAPGVGAQVEIRNDGTMVTHDGKGGSYTFKRDGTGTATYTDAKGATFKLEADADGNTVMVAADGTKTVVASSAEVTMQKNLASMFMDMLDVSDEEWKAIEPKIIKVNRLNQDLARGTQTGGVTIPGTGMTVGGTPSELLKANQDLKKLVDDKNASDDNIKIGIIRVHEAKAKVVANLEAAKKDLNASLTPRQQAALMGAGGRGGDND